MTFSIVITLKNFDEAAKWIVEWIKVLKHNATVSTHTHSHRLNLIYLTIPIELHK